MSHLEVELSHTRATLQASNNTIAQLRQELQDLQNEFIAQHAPAAPHCATQTQILTEPSVTSSSSDFDPDYNYGYSPRSIAQLACLIARHLLSKPP